MLATDYWLLSLIMLVLGIDTATAVASVGLVRDGAPLAENSLRETTNHTETLLPLIVDVLTRTGISLADVEGIGVSIGPGSFTGLRIALGTVKGFSYALGHKVVGVSTLEALAHTVSGWEGLVCPILDARKREVYAALFQRGKQGNVDRLSPDQVLAPQAILERITEPCVFLGDGVETYGSLIQERCGSAAQILPFATHHPCGMIVAKLAWERLRQGEYDDLSTLVPAYVRLPEAVLKRAE
jgi:tRNA threonylcarbamoyladenosine biosynthesis protein TsaB